MRRATLTLEGQSWSLELDEAFVGAIETIHPWIFICPHCDQIWARIQLAPSPEHPRYWDAWVTDANCAECYGSAYDESGIPGSLLVEFPGAYGIQLLRALPRELLDREFTLHLKALEYGRSNPIQHAASGSGSWAGGTEARGDTAHFVGGPPSIQATITDRCSLWRDPEFAYLFNPPGLDR